MKIQKKRIYSLQNNLPTSLKNKYFIPGIVLNQDESSMLLNLGFTEKLEVGESLLPRIVGPITKFNAEGKEIPDKTKDKETKYRIIEWCWNQWKKGGGTEEVCDFRLVPYQRWQRIQIMPPSIQLVISKKEAGKIYVTTDKAKFSEQDETDAINKINLLLEVFGECEILDENSVPLVAVSKTLNWRILPPGKRPWSELQKYLKTFTDSIKDKRYLPVLETRLSDVNNLQPEFTAVGNQGFNGYLVFGFPKKNIYILESMFYGNAIYVFNKKWEEFSKMTKAEILKNNFQVERITHNGEKTNWIKRLADLIK